ncbi:MAG: hypothetical protein WA660_11390, partial [Candidatus Acidiferrales bacterium]
LGRSKNWILNLALAAGAAMTISGGAKAANLAASPAREPQAATAPAKALGAIETISGNQITLKTDAGVKVSVSVADGARILEIAPGETDLKKAVAIPLSSLQAGDRILVRGPGDAKSIAAAVVIAMKKSDVDAQQQAERTAWQHGVGGLVSAVDTTNGTIVISRAAPSGAKTITVHVLPGTAVRRYSADSVKFEDAKPSTLSEIQVADQVRARGTPNADGTEFNADAIVSGSFRNVAGRITAADAATQTITVNDAISKKPVAIKITAQTQLRRLSPEVAVRLAARFAAPGGNGGAAGMHPTGGMGAREGGTGGGTGGPGATPASSPARPARDISQILNSQPSVTMSDLHSGDAVMVVATGGAEPDDVTAVALLDGVDALLSSASSAQGFALSPWTLGPQGGDTEQ